MSDLPRWANSGSSPPPGYALPLGAPGEVQTLSPLVRRILAPNSGVMTGEGTNTYVVGPVRGDGDLVVIDPGPDDPAHVDAIVRAGAGRIALIAITHGHHDHWPAATTLASRTGAKVLAMARIGGLHIDMAIGDGTEIETDDLLLEAIETPGHAAGHLCFLLHDERLLFTGDQVMHGSTVVLFPPEGDVAAYLDSLGRLRSLSPPPLALAPAHGPVFLDPSAAIDAIVDHRLAREAKVLAALRAAGGAVTVDDLLPAVYDDVDSRRLAIARGSLWAHLRKLGDDGLAASTAIDDLERGRWFAS